MLERDKRKIDDRAHWTAFTENALRNTKRFKKIWRGGEFTLYDPFAENP
ncbi:MAG: hypothetical protein M5R36_21495 [Deltaproteobacteria bacterium]|nr:hypothetical protein [Deltaproteobacteria bacterium]